jgi:anti-sigma regulatory factor (Ser/Thr protein kinase)
MRTGAAMNHVGNFHEAAFYSSDDEMLAIMVPFLREGSDAGEPTLVAVGERSAGLVRSALPSGARVEFLPGGNVYHRPAAAIRAYRQLMTRHVAQGAHQIRVMGQLPVAVFGATWDWWARYESAVNHAYDEFPMWSICAYDTRIIPSPILQDICRTHPHVARPDGRHVPSEPYTDPVQYLSEPRPMDPDPLQRTPPVVEIDGPTPADGRRAVRGADRGLLPAEDIDGLVVAVSEAVTNALLHGRAPVLLKVWSGDDRMIVTVSDAGEGPKDPFAGLLPSPQAKTGGRGLWIAHQVCSHVSAERSPVGFTLRLVAGERN